MDKDYFKKGQDENLLILSNATLLNATATAKTVAFPPKATFTITSKFTRLRHELKKKMLTANEEWYEKDVFDRVIFLWELLVDSLRNIAIPCSEENWNKYRAMSNCIFSPLYFLFFGWGSYEHHELVVAGGLGIAMLVIVWKTSHIHTAPSYIWIFCLLGFINSIIFIG